MFQVVMDTKADCSEIIKKLGEWFISNVLFSVERSFYNVLHLSFICSMVGYAELKMVLFPAGFLISCPI